MEQGGSGAEKWSDSGAVLRVKPAWLPMIIWVGSAHGDHKCPQGISNPLQVPEATRLSVLPNQRGTFPPRCQCPASTHARTACSSAVGVVSRTRRTISGRCLLIGNLLRRELGRISVCVLFYH